MVPKLGARVRGEVRQLRERQVDLDHAAPGLPVLDVPGEVAREVLLADMVEERGAGMQGRDDRARPELITVIKRDTNRTAILDEDLADLRVKPDLHADAPGGGGDRVGDCPHASLREPPVAKVTIAN